MEYVKTSKERNIAVDKSVQQTVSAMIEDVRQRGDEAVFEYSEKFDGSTRRADGLGLRVTADEIAAAYQEVDQALIKDMARAAMNILAFAEAQKMSLQEVHDFSPMPGIFLGHRIIPIDSCLCYVPGGNYPLYSTALMLIIPAKEAGVNRVIACSPVEKGTNKINAKTLVAMDIAGADEIYAIGGTQAIAAAAYGTESIAPVDLIVGPGNQYVAEAKRQCYGQVGIDFVAGPSEVMVIADGTGNPKVVAADLLAQAEHDVNAKSILVVVDGQAARGSADADDKTAGGSADADDKTAGDSAEADADAGKSARDFAEAVIKAVSDELQTLDTADIARVSWENNGEVMVASSRDEAIEYANKLAPEHLELNISAGKSNSGEIANNESLNTAENPDVEKTNPAENEDSVAYYLKKLKNYGSLFIGQNTAEVFGDYASGPNHTLPTVKASRYTGGLWVGTFLKTVTYQYMSDEGSHEIAPVVRRLAEGEGLSAHAIAAKLREK